MKPQDAIVLLTLMSISVKLDFSTQGFWGMIIHITIWIFGFQNQVYPLPTEIPQNLESYNPNSIDQNEKLLRLFQRLVYHTEHRLIRLKNEAKARADNEVDKSLQDFTIKEIIEGITEKSNGIQRDEQKNQLTSANSTGLQVQSRFFFDDRSRTMKNALNSHFKAIPIVNEFSELSSSDFVSGNFDDMKNTENFQNSNRSPNSHVQNDKWKQIHETNEKGKFARKDLKSDLEKNDFNDHENISNDGENFRNKNNFTSSIIFYEKQKIHKINSSNGNSSVLSSDNEEKLNNNSRKTELSDTVKKNGNNETKREIDDVEINNVSMRNAETTSTDKKNTTEVKNEDDSPVAEKLVRDKNLPAENRMINFEDDNIERKNGDGSMNKNEMGVENLFAEMKLREVANQIIDALRMNK